MKETTMIPKDFSAAVKEIKPAILLARARAAQVSSVEALKLYLFTGGYISKKACVAKWGSGTIDALSDRPQVELPGLHGFAPLHIHFIRQFYDEWDDVIGLPSNDGAGIRYLPSSESEDDMRYQPSFPSTNEVPHYFRRPPCH